jgi:menaquinone-dependent protoporphyrinogen IX oxidase
MKTLIVFYSRTGTTKIVAEALAKELAADVEELKDGDGIDYSGSIGWLKAGRSAFMKVETKLRERRYDPKNYDLVVIGSPTWAGLCPPAIRSYIKKYKHDFRDVAIFNTQGSSRRQRTLDDLKAQLGREPRAELFLPTKEVRQGDFAEKLRLFIK